MGATALKATGRRGRRQLARSRATVPAAQGVGGLCNSELWLEGPNPMGGGLAGMYNNRAVTLGCEVVGELVLDKGTFSDWQPHRRA